MPSSTALSLSSQVLTAPRLSGNSTEVSPPESPTRNPGDVERFANVLCLGLYFIVGFFFFIRFVRYRKGPSLALALATPLGWMGVVLESMGWIRSSSWAGLRWVGIGLALWLLALVTRWDKNHPEPKE
jgi:hypothetical protein